MPDPLSQAERERLRERAQFTLNGATGAHPWEPYEETWHDLANGVLRLLASLDAAEQALRRLASQEGFEGAGWVGGDSIADRELRARGQYASDALSRLGAGGEEG